MDGIRSKVLLDHPYAALAAGPIVIRETVFGIAKRLDFFLHHIEAFREQVGLGVEEVRILDIGCGTGVNVAIPLANSGYSVVGLDLDLASVQRARLLARGFRNVHFVCGSTDNLRTHQSFHVAICSEVLEHLEEPAGLLRQAAAVLNEGGLFLVTVPNGLGYFELESVFWRFLCRYPHLVERLYQCENYFWKKFGSIETLCRREEEYAPMRLESTWSTLAPDTAHFQSFTRPKIVQLLKGEGFCVLEVHNNTFLAGNLLGFLVRELDSFISWNCRIAEKLPSAFVSGWLIATRRLIH